jgi:drug/metabolite transporter (DMT)-like permease
MNVFALAVSSIAISVAAQYCLKAGMSGLDMRALVSESLNIPTALAILANPFVLAGLVLYAVSAVAWLGVLARWDVSKAYPMVGLGFVATVGIGVLVGEQVNAARAAGVAFICLGVWLVARS